MDVKAEFEYEAPNLTELGTLAALTLAPCKPKHETWCRITFGTAVATTAASSSSSV